MRKYDFILPIGATCVTAHNLRKCKLQKESLPFDWIWVPSINTITELFKHNFANFFLKDNLVYIKNNGDADIYRDTSNNTEFWHDFMTGREFAEIYPKIQNKYQRRIKRTYEYINKAQSILLFRVVKVRKKSNKYDDYMYVENLQKPQDLINEVECFQQLFPNKKVELLLIYMHDNECILKEYDVSNSIHIAEMYNDEKFGWQGDEQQIAKILQNYNLTFIGKLRYFINTVKFKFFRLFNKIMHK